MQVQQKPDVADETLIALIHEERGNISAVARRVNKTRNYILKRRDASPAVREAYDDAREELVDLAEQNIFKKIVPDESNPNPDLNLSVFVLRTLGKNRGYSNREEVTGKDGGPIETINNDAEAFMDRIKTLAKKEEGE